MDRFTINQNLLCEPKIKLAEWQHLYLRPRCRDQPLAAGVGAAAAKKHSDDACLRCNISVCVLQSSRYVFLPLSSRDALMSLSVYCTLRLAHTRAYTKTEDSPMLSPKPTFKSAWNSDGSRGGHPSPGTVPPPHRGGDAAAYQLRSHTFLPVQVRRARAHF